MGCSSLESTHFKKIYRNLNNLRFLDVKDCELLKTDDFEEILKKLLLLETLIMADASQNYNCITQLPKLKQLEIYNSKLFSSSASSELVIKLAQYQAEQLENLKLFIPDCPNLEKVGELKKLKVLFINKNRLLDNECLKKISLLTELQQVDFGDCPEVTDNGILLLFKHCLKLELLNLVGCRSLTCYFIVTAIKVLREQHAKMQRSNIIHIVVSYVSLYNPELKHAADVLEIKFALYDICSIYSVYENNFTYSQEESNDENLNDFSMDIENNCSISDVCDLFEDFECSFCGNEGYHYFYD